MSMLSRIFHFSGYKNIDYKLSTRDKTIEILIEPRSNKAFRCHRCKTHLTTKRGKHRLKIKELSVMGMACFVSLWRRKGHCPKCNKARSEQIEFLAKESPHLTQRYSWWLGSMCEIAAESRVAEFCGEDKMTVMRVDYARLRAMAKKYKIPPVKRISVDEVYARKKGKTGESRDKKFFTVITDLATRKVVWVTQSRSREALDSFFKIIGKEACKDIEAVAMDQHEPYRASVRQNCPKAAVVWDRFHLMQSFNEVANDLRKDVFHQCAPKSDIKPYVQGKNRFIFLKRDSKRSQKEKEHLKEAMSLNWPLMQMELIKERLYTFFGAKSVHDAWSIWDEIGDFVDELDYHPLKRWFYRLDKEWDTLKNYFDFRITSAVSEGINNVIKSLKRRAFGYRRMDHFQLKIMQVCGYLNSRYIKTPGSLIT